MKRFVLTLEIMSRSNPAKVILEIIASKAKEARRIALTQDVEEIPDKNAWLNPRKTTCRGYRTNRTVSGVESIRVC